MGGNARLTVDLERAGGGAAERRGDPLQDRPASRKHLLLNGLDDIGQTMQHAPAIDAYEAKQTTAQPGYAG